VPSSAAAQSAASVSDAARTGTPSTGVGFDDAATGSNFRILGIHLQPTRIDASRGVNPDASPIGYPLDVTKGSGPDVTSISAYDVYVNCPKKDESCWGQPEQFLKGLAGSSYAGMITQYTGGPAADYTYGGSLAVSYANAPKTFYNADIFAILASAVKHFGKVGLTAEYHIFLPSGTDTCLDRTSDCYSPDDVGSFTFCAYHGAVTYNKKALLFSVEPYQNATIKSAGKVVYPCQSASSPDFTNRLYSATASTLAYESFGTWSDPEPNSGWYNRDYGTEIGDVCIYRFMNSIPLGSGTWYIQQIYSNVVHGCASQ
jgi:hypothetical protein